MDTESQLLLVLIVLWQIAGVVIYGRVMIIMEMTK